MHVINQIKGKLTMPSMCHFNVVKMINIQKISYGACYALIMSGLSLLLPDYALAHTVNEYVLRIEMAPAICSLEPTQAKQRKCLEGYSFVIKGLYPDQIGQHCMTNRSATLPPLQARAIARVMPNENERQQLWQSVGNCVSGNASQYFRQITTFAERINIPRQLMAEKSYYVKQQTVLQQLHKLNPLLPQNAVRLSCQVHPGSKHSVLTEIKICYTSLGLYKQCSNAVPANCPSNFVIEGTY